MDALLSLRGVTPELPQAETLNVAASTGHGIPSRDELLREYSEAGQFERVNLQLAFNYVTVFLAAMGGTLTVFGNLPTDSIDLRVLTAAFGVVLSIMFLVSGEHRAFRSRAIQVRTKEIESLLGFRLHQRLSADSRVAGLRVTTAGLYRAVYSAGVFVWIYVGIRALVG
jgi:hypothetical protein